MSDPALSAAIMRLEARRKALLNDIADVESAIRAIQKVDLLDQLDSSLTPSAPPAITSTQPIDQLSKYNGKTIAEAVEMLLNEQNRPMRAAEIVDGLKSAGFDIKAKVPANVLHSTLHKREGFVRVSRGLWALEKWGGAPDRPPHADTSHSVLD